MDILQRVFPANLPDYYIKNDRISLVIDGEIGISTAILEAGYSITSISFPDCFYKKLIHGIYLMNKFVSKRNLDNLQIESNKTVLN